MNGLSNRPINGPIIDKGESGGNKIVLIVVGVFALVIGIGSFYLIQKPVEVQQEIEAEEIHQEVMTSKENELQEDVKEELPKEIDGVVEEANADFYYQRALKKEKEKDYEGAVADYGKTIELAKKYSAEMWNALNNRGVINTKHLKDYKAATKDFNKIIQTETNRYSGEPNATRLEAGYTNRAYLKKMKGDKAGACDDLYEALSLGVDASVDFIEKKIADNCE